MRSVRASLVAVALAASPAAAQPALVNYNFDLPNLSPLFPLTYQYWGAGTPAGGIAGGLNGVDGVGWTFGNLPGSSPAGYGTGITGEFVIGMSGWNQAAFLHRDGGYFFQEAQLEAGSYSVKFRSQGRPGAAYGANPVEVRIDGVPLSFNGAAAVVPTEGVFEVFNSDPVALSAGPHTVSFHGLGVIGRDVMSYVSEVQLVVPPVPEPATCLGIAACGLGAFSAVRRFRAG